MHKSGIHHLLDVVRTLPVNFKTDSGDTNTFLSIFPLLIYSTGHFGRIFAQRGATYCFFVQHVNSFPFVNHHVHWTLTDVLVDFDNSY